MIFTHKCGNRHDEQCDEGEYVNLTPDERQQYGSIADHNKVLVEKAKIYMDKVPQTVPQTKDRNEFCRDYDTHEEGRSASEHLYI